MEAQYKDILESADTPGAASPEAISKAEQELGIVFPASYRRFLEIYGAAMGTGFEIAGLFKSEDDEPPLLRNVVDATKQMRRVAGSTLPEGLLLISSDGVGLSFYLQTASQNQSPVIAYGPGVDGEEAAESFEGFVVKLSTGELNV